MRESSPLRLAIVGGGFTGVALAIHALAASRQPLSIDMIEPAAKLGRGAAYGTTDPDHRLNVPCHRMSLFSDDPADFNRWLFDKKWLPDSDSADSMGRYFVPRSAFAAYAEDMLAQAVSRSATPASLRRWRARSVALVPENAAFRVELADGTFLHADRVALCTGHTPGAPCRIGDGAARHPRLIAVAWAPDSLAAVDKGDRALIVGTGLTMADVVASLARADHQGPVLAVSPRGLLPREQGLFVDCPRLFEGVRPGTALELLRLLRAAVRRRDQGLDWQAVVDALRRRLPEVWPTLPAPERVRAVRRLLPFWEVHRFRIAPQAAAAVARMKAQGKLTIERAKAIEIRVQDGSLIACLRLPGGAVVERAFDSVILCAGPSRNIRDNPLLANLIDRGLAQADEVNLGVRVDTFSRVIDARGAMQPDLFAFGPITRGTFGEMNGAPDILCQIERVVPILTRAQSSLPFGESERFRADANQTSALARGSPALV
ncbi:MAG: FAD/NAD(P)-binding protein [Hyphomicrobiales bacterium]|nr:FAD/NAD(P)-binding protein [Hyphomicrobiales bacterium]